MGKMECWKQQKSKKVRIGLIPKGLWEQIVKWRVDKKIDGHPKLFGIQNADSLYKMLGRAKNSMRL